ncbi:concanavalin A-like lectin/glucanase domain-containing protein [Aspergillus multicolor]|uniref:concanavalin A-like lectin/glucanase domain-containing protein n=1 Tax=Aspergillus multicolor TaxID=41759 RepID=UPI003CCD76EE
MRLSILFLATAAGTLWIPARAQSSTSCNPLEKSCPLDTSSAASTMNYNFTQTSALAEWTTTSGSVNLGFGGAEFTINSEGDSPTIETSYYIFFGEISVHVLESDDLDEVDWEVLGGYSTQLQTDYFGKGDSGSYGRWTWEPVSEPQTTFHARKLTWSTEQLVWSIDGETVRTLAYGDAVDSTRYPQTAMRVRLGIWAGGETDYCYRDQSGSDDSIEIIGCNRTATPTSSASASASTCQLASPPAANPYNPTWTPIDRSLYSDYAGL